MSIKPRRWTVESSRLEFADRFLRHRIDRCITERDQVLDPYHVLELNDWCHAVALTEAGELVLVEEYRHASGQVIRGLPAGTVEADEDPAAAMPRELVEETGYRAADWLRLPTVWANPATQTNQVHNFLALGAVLTETQNFDPGETIEVVTVPVADAVAALLDGSWQTHGLHVAAILTACQFARRNVARDPRLAPLAAI
ncbi:MAG: NUDIX hydrolase [Alphaproteobacteria bacterium]|nr:NUDIX hydrolase [Alphaproteobacteria bacterium]